jgi:hypothetical protein
MSTPQRTRIRGKLAPGGIFLLSVIALAGCSNGPASKEGSKVITTTTKATPTTAAAPTTTTTPCPLSGASGSAVTVPVDQVCSAVGTPHFTTPDSAMVYLSAAWNSGNVQQLDYVTDPAGRLQMDSMAAQMVNLQFKSCTANPAGDYTCYFNHNIAPSDSSTTYPNPMNYPPGEAVFTVAPAATPGWYLTEVEHCG